MNPIGTSTRRRSTGAGSLIAFRTTVLLCLAACLVITLPGCSGCWRQDPLAKRKKDAKKKEVKPDFELGRLEIQPRDPASNMNFVKAGHWMATTREMKANNFDFKAEAVAACVNRSRNPFVIPNTRFQLKSSRPVGLPKGQLKHVECQYFIPSLPQREGGSNMSRQIWLQNSLLARRGGRVMVSDETPTTTLPHYQYFLVVLSTDPNRYGYLKSKNMSSISPPVEDVESGTLDNILHYRVMLPQIEQRVPLPSQPLLWTSIAYIVWDGMNPNVLTPDQQQALLDWLHWGGQLVISGPQSMDLLRGSFLDAYLPAAAGPAVTLQAPVFAELDRTWSLIDHRSSQRYGLKISAEKPPMGVVLEKQEDSAYLPGTGDLVLERWLGAGRIVVTRFSLSDRQIVNWGSFDSFFNACLLRRPNRTFHLNNDQTDATVGWASAREPAYQTDARFVTNLRYFTRDSAATPADDKLQVRNSSQVEVAGWNPRSAASNAARESLNHAAGISIPKAEFVFRVLAVYLLVLVPLNWIVFRLMGHVEWAWVAAPLIAVGGGVAIVRLAQLDIGFARSRTEIAVLELQGDYPRGHLTRYTALYTALSTAYDLVFDDDSALAMPFPSQPDFQPGRLEKLYTVHYRRDKNLSLSGFQVESNSTGTVQSEQMITIRGPIHLVGDDRRGFVVENASEIRLNDVGLLRRNGDGTWQIAWIGQFPAGTNRTVEWTQVDTEYPAGELWKTSGTTYSCERQRADIFRQFDADGDKRLLETEVPDAHPLNADFLTADRDNSSGLDEREVLLWCAKSREGEPTLGRLFDLASLPGSLQSGEIRLLGWTDQPLPGLTTHPTPAQSLVLTMVIAHLTPGSPPAAKPDTNLRIEVSPIQPEKEAEEKLDPATGLPSTDY